MASVTPTGTGSNHQSEVQTESVRSANQKFNPSFDRDGMPLSMRWDYQDVADWIEFLGLRQYRACFTTNYINGRKLIRIDASSLPKIGITDFEHIKFISAKVRELLGIEEPYWNRSITLPHREPKSLYLERKSQTGTDVDGLTYDEHLRELNRLNQHGVPRQHDVSW